MIPDPTHSRCLEQMSAVQRDRDETVNRVLNRLADVTSERDKLRRKAAELCNRVLSGTAGCSSRKTADLARELRELCRAG